jgi:hypothetical protein
MHNLITDSLLFPQNLLKYRQKSGLFVFFFVLIMALFVSLDGIIFFIGYSGNSTVTTATTGCTFEGGALSCQGADYAPDHRFAYFGYSLYFLEEGDVLTDPESQRIVLQTSSLRIFANGTELYQWDLSMAMTDTSFDDFFATLTTAVRWSGGVFLIISNILVILGIALMTSLSFLRIARFVRYKVIFKLVLFALTPFVLLLTLYNLLEFHLIIFFLLMAISYRSVFVLLQVLTRETYIHLNEMENAGGTGSTPETVSTPANDEALEESEENDTETSHEDIPDDEDGE